MQNKIVLTVLSKNVCERGTTLRGQQEDAELKGRVMGEYDQSILYAL
jgi:hypothetical protein